MWDQRWVIAYFKLDHLTNSYFTEILGRKLQDVCKDDRKIKKLYKSTIIYRYFRNLFSANNGGSP